MRCQGSNYSLRKAVFRVRVSGVDRRQVIHLTYVSQVSGVSGMDANVSLLACVIPFSGLP